MSAAALLKTDHHDIKSLLQSCDLMQEAPPEALHFAAQHSERVIFNQGDCIILENEANDWVYFIAQGSVEIVSYLAGDNRIQRLALLKSGQNFAEFSILTKSARSGSAYAFENCVLIRMEGSDFISLLKNFPTVSQRFLKHLAEINSQFENREMLSLYQPAQLALSQETLQHFPLALCQKFGVIPISLKAGTLTVIMKNPSNKGFYETVQRSLPGTEVVVQWISETEFESAFQSAQKSLKLSLVSKTSAGDSLGDPDPAEAFRASNVFGEIKHEILQQILPHMKTLKVKAGQHIFEPGASIDDYHLIAQGRVQFLRKLQHFPAQSQILTLSAGEGFGEVQLITGAVTGYAVRALEDSVLFSVPSNIFKQLLKLPIFSLALAKSMAQKLQVMGHNEGLQYFHSNGTLDFSEVSQLLPVTLMEAQKILPLTLKDNEVLLGALHPDSSEVLAATRRYLLNYRVKIQAVAEEQFKTWLQQLKVHAGNHFETAPVLSASSAQKPKLDVTKWIDQILLLGMNNRASDIHFEPTEERLTIRFRIDGVLQEHSESLPAEAGKEVINRLKILSDMDISQFHMPQDGQLKLTVGKSQIMARASTIPVRFGEKIVLRLIRSQSSVVPLGMLAADRRVINILTSVTRCRQGLFLVTGPTGSGKTTTLYSMLNAINDIGVNVVTLEDPVEMEIAGFNQIEMDRKRGLDFNVALRSVLRQDPNVIMVGEIRDEESAKIVMEASITGHLVLSTLHTSSSLDIAPRLHELGVTPATLASGLLGVLSQRLLRMNCKKCLTVRPTLESEKEFFQQVLKLENPPEELHHSVGCPACAGTGFLHRIPVFEVWRNTPAMRKALLEKQSTEDMTRIAREDGFETMLESSLRLVLSGLVSLEEVHRVLSSI